MEKVVLWEFREQLPGEQGRTSGPGGDLGVKRLRSLKEQDAFYQQVIPYGESWGRGRKWGQAEALSGHMPFKMLRYCRASW